MKVKHYSCEEFTLKQAMDDLRRLEPKAVVTEVNKKTLTALATGQRTEIWTLKYKEATNG